MLREIRGASKCQNCGNQAKKGCEFMRCRTCCNNKGFRCLTHVNSTWVPTSRRRHLQSLTHNNKPSPGLEEMSKLPGVMSSTAVFRCVRVRSEDDTVDEYAYQTCVNIGGRVFSGVLYDQGPESELGFYCHNNNDLAHSSKTPLNLIHHPHHHDQLTSMIQSHDAAAAAAVPPSLIMSSSSAEHSASSSSYPLSLGTTFRPSVSMSYFTTQPNTSS